MKVLMVGSRGQVGSLLSSQLLQAGFETAALNSQELDISSIESVMSWQSWQPELIINAAAYTAVDLAESEPEKAFQVNEAGLENLLLLAQSCDCPIFNISTDYVFDGSSVRPYMESDPVSPLGIYGRSKRAGEVKLENADHPYINIRTSWVFGENGNNFVKTMLRLGRQHETLNVVADQYGCPTYAGDIANVLVTLAEKLRAGEDLYWGHFHYSGAEQVSWHGFAQFIFQQAVRAGQITREPVVNPISTEQYPTAAARPAYSVLDTAEINKRYNIEPSNWKIAVRELMQKLEVPSY
ncbi:dTDP-4-dehydrorhamnose reductase [Amphritea sp. HPY]|uniref:dTDP-4-dehydrorhamnose reductase n=1 Tax=Amphritea sp. HPY TaxID=3421652 RepID=UPI003D7EF141